MPTVDDFLVHYGDQTFRHYEELMAGIRAGDCELFDTRREGAYVLTRQLLDIYRTYADRLRSSAEARTFLIAEKAGMLADVEALIIELESRLLSHAEEPCGLWNFMLRPRYILTVYDAPLSGRVLGCLRAVLPDDRFAKREAPAAPSTRQGLAINLISRGTFRH